jgi:hypothetical protein
LPPNGHVKGPDNVPDLDSGDGIAANEWQRWEHVQTDDLEPELANRVFWIDFTCQFLRLWVNWIVVRNVNAPKPHELGDEEWVA